MDNALKVGSQTNCTSLPDSLNSISFDICGNAEPVEQQQSTNNMVNNLYFMQTSQIPSIVINSNEVESSTSKTLPWRRSSNKNKRATSLLVRFTQDADKVSKLEKIRMKIMENKQRSEANAANICNGDKIPSAEATANTTRVVSRQRDEADSGLCSANEEPNIVISEHQPLHLIETNPFKEFKVNEKQLLIRSLTKPFATIRRQANRTMKQQEKSQNSPKSPTSKKTSDDAETHTPVKQANSLRTKTAQYEMPCLSEESQINESKVTINNAISNSNLSVNQNSDPVMGPQKSVNLLLDYLINNSKEGGNVNGSKLDVANLAALAALVDLRESDASGDDIFMGDSASNELALKHLLIDLVSSPPMATATSQFELSSAGSSVEHIELHVNNSSNCHDSAASPHNLNVTTAVTAKGGQIAADAASFNINFNASNGINTNGMNNKKQVNEQIMRACMGYLDYINKKHNRERRIQIIRNKISGFVLLTIVFMLIIGLSLVMTFFLGRAFTNMLKKAALSSNALGTSTYEVNESGNNNNMKEIISSTLTPFGGNPVQAMLQSEHMTTAPIKPTSAMAAKTNMSDEQSCELIKRSLRLALRELIKKTNLSRTGMEKLAKQLTRNFFNTTIVEILNSTTINDTNLGGQQQQENGEIEELEEEDSSSHYIELIDELN